MKSDESTPNIPPIEGRKHKLSKENILKYEVFGKIDTFPYLPRGFVPTKQTKDKLDIERSRKEYVKGISEIKRVVEEFVNRQRTIVSWILAVSSGVIGNLLINLFFGPMLFYFPDLYSIILAVSLAIILIVLVCTIFLYYPTNLNYQVNFIPPHKNPQISKPAIKEDELSPKANMIIQHDFAFLKSIEDYTNIISIAILRDFLSKTDKKVLKVSKLFRLSPDVPFYIITFDLRSRYLFWSPKITDKIANDLYKINENLMLAQRIMDVHIIDQNEERWKEKGHVFLNEICEWNMKDVVKAIEEQIMLSK